MFRIFYTTQMSSNARQLQARFTKMRSKSGRVSKIMAAVMAVAVVMAMATATVVMAAVGADGLEHWDSTEIYLKESMSFDINISGLYVPEYVKTDIAGDDGNIHCEVKNYDYRGVGGAINCLGTLTLTGGRGKIVMELQNGSYTNGETLNPEDEAHKYLVSIKERTGAESLTDLHYAVNEDTGKYTSGELGCDTSEEDHRAAVFFAIADNRCIDVVFSFDGEYVLKEDLSIDNIGQRMDFPPVTNVKMFGTMADSVTTLSKLPFRDTKFFSTYEQTYYKNLSIDGFDIDIIGASGDTISIKSNVTYDKSPIEWVWFKAYDANNVPLANYSIPYNKNGTFTGYGIQNNINGTITGTVSRNLESGKTYRVEISYWEGRLNNMVYRWMGYVTAK